MITYLKRDFLRLSSMAISRLQRDVQTVASLLLGPFSS